MENQLLFEAAARLPYAPVFVTVSGAHLYGFASPDSDFDLRGAHALPLRELVGLFRGRETVEISEVRDGLEWDIVSHDAAKFCRLLLKNSGYALEQLVSPLEIVSSPAHRELQAIARRGLNRGYARHYRGFALNQWRLFQKESPPRAKPLLYVFRVLQTGIWLLETGELEANLERLNREFEVPRVDELIALKRQTREKITLPDADLSWWHAQFETLVARLERAERSSVLPAHADVSAEMDEWLVKLRLGGNDET